MYFRKIIYVFILLSISKLRFATFFSVYVSQNRQGILQTVLNKVDALNTPSFIDSIQYFPIPRLKNEEFPTRFRRKFRNFAKNVPPCMEKHQNSDKINISEFHRIDLKFGIDQTTDNQLSRPFMLVNG